MKQQLACSMVVIVLLEGCTVMARPPSQTMPPGSMDPSGMLGAMQAAHANAARQGDEKLSCEALEAELVAVTADPALQAQIEAAGQAAQRDQTAMQGSSGLAAMQTIRTVMASFLPGAAMGTFIVDSAQTQAQGAQAADRMQSRMLQAQQMMTVLPQLLRGQRLIELASAKPCEWAEGALGMPDDPASAPAP